MLCSIRKALLLTVGASAFMNGTASHAQVADSSVLEEVVVTAERREQDIQKIAASVSVRNGEDLSAQGRYTLEQILQNVPGVQGGAAQTAGTGGGSGTDSPARGVVIRGIRSNLGTGGSITSVGSSAATYVDDVYQGIGGNYDIGRVEVLRGPQGTLYGRSAVSGAVATYTPNPDFDRFSGFASVEYGGNDVGAREVQHYAGAVNMPLSDQFAIRVAGNRFDQGGVWLNRSGSAGGGGDSKNSQSAAKVKILYKPTDDLSILVGGAFENNLSYSGSTGVTITQPQADNVIVTRSPITSLIPGTSQFRQLWAKLDWNLGFGTLTYIPAVRKFENELTGNGAATNVNCQTLTNAQLFAIGAICFRQPTSTPYDQFHTEEIRLSSNPDSRLTWQAGAMYYLNNLIAHTDNEWTNPQDGNKGPWSDSCDAIPGTNPVQFYNPPGACGNTIYIQYETTNKKTEQLGFFAEATYPVTDTLRVTGGVRDDRTTVTNHEFFYAHGTPTCLGGADQYINLGVLGNPPCVVVAENGVRKFHNTTWKLRAEYDVGPQNLLYATVATGASPGDIALSQGADSKPKVLLLTAQTLTSYDLGTKNRFLDNKLQLNGEVYFQDYGGYQDANVNIGTREPLFTAVTTPVEFYGFDTEWLYQLTPNDRVGFNLAYTHGVYTGADNEVVYTTQAGVVTTLRDYIYDETVAGIVPWAANLNYDHIFNLMGGSRVSLHGDVRYTSGYQTARLTKVATLTQGAVPFTYVSSAYVFNTNLMWTSANGNLSINGYVRNLFDNRYKTGGGCGLGAGNCTVVSNRTATVNSPRSFGIVATVSF